MTKSKALHHIGQVKIPTRTVLGVPIAALTLKEISSVIVKLIEGRYKTARAKKTFFYVDANHLNIANKDPFYKKILQRATLAYPTGMGIIFVSKIVGRPLLERTSTLDFIEEVFAVAESKKMSFYLLGGEDHIVKKAVENLLKKFAKLKIAGYHHGFFTNNSEIVEKINLVKPDIILVGMGPPKQEKWIADNIDKVNAGTFWAVGALFDFISGRRKRAPKWMQRLGLEWSFRLFQEPRRLWKRYLFGNIRFLLTVFQETKPFSRKSSH